MASAVLALLAAGCGGAEPPGVVPSSAGPVTTVTDTVPTGGGLLEGFAEIEIQVGGESWTVAFADTAALRSRGLMGVTDLGELRGMLFAWDEDVESGFWMKDTLIPLDIAFFAADGSVVDLLSMVPCEADPCPSYRPGGPYRWALEVPAGGFEHLGTIDVVIP
ncbi:MAG: DUF192 domain-containing protein [Acidimicrobiia bacterium]|nr:DUF192 domain-containing protein [Acidimicrobiia bacterium]